MPSGSNSAADASGLELHDYRSAAANQQSAAPGETAAGVAKRKRGPSVSGGKSERQLTAVACRPHGRSKRFRRRRIWRRGWAPGAADAWACIRFDTSTAERSGVIAVFV